MNVSPHLGALRAVWGRDDSPARQWGQAALLGALGGMFFGPALGFPMLSRGLSHVLFFAALVALAVVLAVLARWARPNRAIRAHEEGWVVVDGAMETPLAYASIARAAFEKGRLHVIDTDGRVATVRLSRAVAGRALQDLAERVGSEESR